MREQEQRGESNTHRYVCGGRALVRNTHLEAPAVDGTVEALEVAVIEVRRQHD